MSHLSTGCSIKDLIQLYQAVVRSILDIVSTSLHIATDALCTRSLSVYIPPFHYRRMAIPAEILRTRLLYPDSLIRDNFSLTPWRLPPVFEENFFVTEPSLTP